MRYLGSALLVLAVFLVVTYLSLQYDARLDPSLYTYVTRHFEAETGARNAVAAILLFYRMYDTLFEALILVTAIIGMQQFLPKPDDPDSTLEIDHE